MKRRGIFCKPKYSYGTSWHPDTEGILLTASEDTTVCQWDIKGYAASKDLPPVRTYRGHTAWVEDVAWSELLEPLFASVGDDKRLMM